MYKNSKHTVLFPLLLAAGVVLGLVLGQYLGRNTTTSQLKGMLSRMALPNNKLSYTLSCRWTRSPSTLSRCWSRSWTPIRSISPPRKCRL